MPGLFARAALIAIAALSAIAVVSATSASAQTHRRHHPREEEERAAPAAPAADKRDTVVAAPGPYSGHSYWLSLAQCGGIYFKLNTLYTDAAVHARVVKPDPHANAEYSKKLTDAIKVATAYFDAVERFLMNDRGVERTEAVLTYDGQSRAAGDRVKTIEAGLAAAKACPALYQACQAAYPKVCSESLVPLS